MFSYVNCEMEYQKIFSYVNFEMEYQKMFSYVNFEMELQGNILIINRCPGWHFDCETMWTLGLNQNQVYENGFVKEKTKIITSNTESETKNLYELYPLQNINRYQSLYVLVLFFFFPFFFLSHAATWEHVPGFTNWQPCYIGEFTGVS